MIVRFGCNLCLHTRYELHVRTDTTHIKRVHASAANSIVLYFDLLGSQDVSSFQDKESEFLVTTIPDMTSEAPFSKKFRVTDQVRRSFDKEGFFILRSLFSKEEVNLFRFFYLNWCDATVPESKILFLSYISYYLLTLPSGGKTPLILQLK